MEAPPTTVLPAAKDSAAWNVPSRNAAGAAANRVALEATAPGTAVIRVRYTPMWNVTSGSACVQATDGNWTQLQIQRPGHIELTASLLHPKSDCDTTPTSG